MKIPFIDGHNDTLMNFENDVQPFFSGTKSGHIDWPRGVNAGFAAGFFAVFCPNPDTDPLPVAYKTDKGYEKPLPPCLKYEYACRYTNKVVARFLQLEKQSKGRFKIARTIQDLDQAIAGEHMAGILHIEGAEGIDEDLNMLHVLYEAGLRSVGPVWSRANMFAEGVPYRFPSTPDTGPGLTENGKKLVEECNHLGIMVDLSHLNEKGFWDVATISRDPLVATHSNAHKICPVTRNLTDKQIDAIGDSNGLIGVTYSINPNMVTADGGNNEGALLSEITKHIHYIADRIGIDHVSLGSDFDGTRVPKAMKDVSGVPKLIALLRKEGWSEEEVEKIAYKNWIRVLKETWKK
ncbi:membrane dipeptidase [Halobacillus karajensis]|uniref:dipeptidase n=1 Tax=Halobacillus karajensis TaxID=195088 RepID=UPI0008A7D468|nr:dipeptidase [Halobacillus karajensis]SEH82850.1 membrane dipeptidase [Halobacillus karajensis]